ncbi:MAG: hypothetical protein R2758_02845 [Bacteroidales bacterium]
MRIRTYLLVLHLHLAMGFNFVSLHWDLCSIFYVFGGDKVAEPNLGINGTIWAITGVLAVFPLNSWISPG